MSDMYGEGKLPRYVFDTLCLNMGLALCMPSVSVSKRAYFL